MAQELNERQRAIDEVATEWFEARGKQVFGHRGFVRCGKMFGFLTGEGVAVRVYSDEEAEEWYSRDGVTVFTYHEMEMRAWPVLPLRTDEEFDAAIDALHRAYEFSVPG